MANKKTALCSLAALGLVAGSMGQAEARCTSPSTEQKTTLFKQLDKKHQQMYDEMDCMGQNQAVNMAEQMCKPNTCAGPGTCKQQPQTKNSAIDVAYKMYQKRMKSAQQG